MVRKFFIRKEYMNKFLLYLSIIFVVYSKNILSNPIEIEGFFTNITQLRDSIEQLKSKNEYNDNKRYQFVFNVSSELKNELNIKDNRRLVTIHKSCYILDKENKQNRQICFQYKKLDNNFNFYITKQIFNKLIEHLQYLIDKNSVITIDSDTEEEELPETATNVENRDSDTEEEALPETFAI